MALKGVKVLEFVGLAPGPFCGKILVDFGASVTRIDKIWENNFDVLQHGKQTLAIDLKKPKGQQLVRRLAAKYDVLIDPFRPGVLEKLNLGPEVLCKEQPHLIYARLSGFGQTGHLAKRAGHDINYVAMSGVLSMLSRHNEYPMPPINILADFAGGGLLCALGICLALLERNKSGRGQVVDAAMVDGAAYVASWLFASRSLPLWGKERGLNTLDGGAFFYGTYKTKDGKYMTVGALEPQFFEVFKQCLGLPDLAQFLEDEEEQKQARSAVQEAFLKRTQSEWAGVFENVDACVYPVLDWQNVMKHDHHAERKSFNKTEGEEFMPAPAPRLSRTPGHIGRECSKPSNAMKEAHSVLNSININKSELQKLINDRVVLLPSTSAKL